MIRAAFVVPLLVGFSLRSPAAEQAQLDASPSVFTVLAAINAAGYDFELDSPNGSPLRRSVRDAVAARKPACLDDLKKFYEAHKQKDPSAEFSQYVSFALLLDGPPDFKYTHPGQPMPPDAAALDGFAPLLARFYKEAGIAGLWRQAQPSIDQAIEQLHTPVTRALMQVNAYLRNPTSGYLGRRYQIYVDLLGPPNQVDTRSYADDYFVVVTPSPQPPIDEIRHAYLHYLSDPLPLKYSKQVDEKRALGDYAQGAPLEDYYKNDFFLLTTECFIKAVESRLAPSRERQALVSQALREGFILTPAFFELLPAYEKQEQAMRLYFPDLVAGIDLGREERRMQNVEFASARAVHTIKVVHAERPVELTGAAKTLADAEKFYAGRDLPKAKDAYLRVLHETGEKSLHAKSYYGLARIAALERDPETAEKLFRKTLEFSPDPDTKSWSLLYLGRLADAQGDREQAAVNYKAALAVEGAPAAVRQAAEKGLKEAFTKNK